MLTRGLLTLNLDPRRRFFWKRESHFSTCRKQRRPLTQSSLCGNLREVRIVGALRKMREHHVLRLAIKTIDQPVGYVFIRQMAQPRKNSLL